MRRSTVVNVESDMGTPMVSEKQQAAAIFERRHVMQDRAGRCGQWDALRLAAFHAPGRGGQDHAIEVELVPSCAADLAAAGGGQDGKHERTDASLRRGHNCFRHNPPIVPRLERGLRRNYAHSRGVNARKSAAFKGFQQLMIDLSSVVV